jgi:hypothetical protein
MDMVDIKEWLDGKVAGLSTDEDSGVEQQAEILRAEAETAGYTAEQLEDACGGDIGDYLRDHGSFAVVCDADDKMAGDLFPMPPLGIKQE